MRTEKTYWISDFNKMKESDWILKLISSNEKNLSKLKDIETSSIFLSDEILFQQITTDINSIVKKDSMELIKELVQLRERIIDEQTYLTEFKNKITKSIFKDYFRGTDIPDLTFDNYGFINWNNSVKIGGKISSYVIEYDTRIKNSLLNQTNLVGIDNEQKQTLYQSIKSSTGWFKIDYKKHAIGSMVDILKLTTSLLTLKGNANAKLSEKKEAVKFLVDIFQLHYKKGIRSELEKKIVDIFFSTHSQFLVPVWGKKDKNISLEIVKLSTEDIQDDELLANYLNKKLNSFISTEKSGISETLIMILFNIFNELIKSFSILYNQLYEIRILDDSIDEIEKNVINGSIKESIQSFQRMIHLQMKDFFGLQNDIKLMNDKNLFPSLSYSKGASNIFRIIEGINSISKKEKCDMSSFPIKIKEDDKIRSIDYDLTLNALIEMFMNKTDISMGGFVLYNENSFINRNCQALHRYLEKNIKSKTQGIKKIDTEFNKMIKGIRLNHVHELSKYIESRFKKIISENNLLLKKAVFNDISQEFLFKYNEYRMKELLVLKELIENNKYLKTGNRRNSKTLKELVRIQKKLVVEYYSIQNISYVFNLLLSNIYKTMQNALLNKGANISKVMPNNFITELISKIEEVNQKINKNKDSLNTRNINALGEKIKKGQNISLNMTGGDGLFNWIKIDESHQSKTIDKYLKKILEDSKLTDTEKSLLIKKIFSEKSILKKKKTKNKTKNKIVKRPLNKLKNSNRLVVSNDVLDIDFWQNVEESLCGKKIFIPFYEPKNLITTKGIFDLFYSPTEGELNKESKYISSLSKKHLLGKITQEGFLLVCSETSDLEKIETWRLLKKSFIKELKNQSASFIRRKIYGLVKSQAQYIKNTYVWKNSLLKEDKLLIQNICKAYHNKLSGCQIIISREELSNYI
jgi:uncharacterized protein (DUF1810 family)